MVGCWKRHRGSLPAAAAAAARQMDQSHYMLMAAAAEYRFEWCDHHDLPCSIMYGILRYDTLRQGNMVDGVVRSCVDVCVCVCDYF